MSNKKMNQILSDTISKYRDLPVGETLSKLRSEINDVLNQYLTDNYVIKEDFPIVFENEYGKWEIHSDGNAYVQPKKGRQFIECNITIKKTGQIDYE